MKKPVAKKLSLDVETIASLQLDAVSGGAGAQSQLGQCLPQSQLLGRTCLLCMPDQPK
jgi:hypothetical protein